MALPAGVTTCVVTAGAPLDFAGQPGTIILQVTPTLGGNATNIVWQATGQESILCATQWKTVPALGFKLSRCTHFRSKTGNAPGTKWKRSGACCASTCAANSLT